jgi:hypothetical protein
MSAGSDVVVGLLGPQSKLRGTQLKCGKHHFLSLPVLSQRRFGVQRGNWHGVLFILFLVSACVASAVSPAQSAPDSGNTIRGVVMNSVTHQPVDRALVYSPDNRFGTLTNSEGRFEFTVPTVESPPSDGADPNAVGQGVPGASNRPYMLTARKPGFMPDPNNPGQNLQNDLVDNLTLSLVPESLITGTVTLPSSEPSDSVQLQIFRRQVQDGRAHWVQAGGTQSTSDGQFRFADLPSGTYKLLTGEQLDRDPVMNDPLAGDPFGNTSRGPFFGYPPVYYQHAPDFESAATISLAAGQTQTVNLTLAKQPYYRVKVPVIVSSSDQPAPNAIRVSVYLNGRKGPGYSLGYNNADHTIQGMLPNGTYTLEASSFGSNGVSGTQSITIKGAPINGPSMVLVPNTSIPVILREEFTGTERDVRSTRTVNARSTVLKGTRRYLAGITLEPDDETGMRGGASLRDPTRPDDDTLFIDGVAAGSYWVRVIPALGYAASVRSGNTDLLHQPLVVGTGGGVPPIEITLRDDTAEISGTVAGMTAPPTTQAQMSPYGRQAGAQLYCIPVSDSAGQFMQIWVGPDGNFSYSGLAPGTYRLLAFEHEQREFEYRNPDAMLAYDSKGPLIRLLGGQKEHVQLQLITTSN